MPGDGLHLAAAGGGQLGLALDRVVLEVLDPDQGRGQLIGTQIGGGLFLGGLIVRPDDQRGPRLVDQDAVGLVDDRVMVGALDRRLGLGVITTAQERLLERLARGVATELQPLQLVAEEVEAELLAGAVGDVAGIRRPAIAVGLPRLDAADGHPKQAVNRRHPIGVALGQVVVDRDNVDAFALERVQVRRQGGDQGLPLAGLHLGDRAEVDGRAADELDVVMPLLDGPFGRLAHQGEGLDEQGVERVPLPGSQLEGMAPLLQVVVALRARAPAQER